MDHREHLTPLDVAALVEDELARGDIYRCWDHLAECPACTWFLVTVITMGEPETEEERGGAGSDGVGNFGGGAS